MKKNRYKYLIPLVLISIFFVTQVNAETCQQYWFGSAGVKVYVYDDYRAWDFTVEDDLTVNFIEVQSVIRSASMIVGGDFGYVIHKIEILHNGVLIDRWDAETSPIEAPQIHQADVSPFEIKSGDTLTYRIGGGAPAFVPHVSFCYITGPNYVKLCGDNSAGEPLPDIKANGSDGPLTVSSSTPVSITVSLDPGGQAGQNADWWVYADTPSGSYSYVYPSGWRPGLTRAIVNPLFSLSSTEILNRTMPVGYYVITFAVDNNADGILDETWEDSVEVTVE